MKEGNFKEDFFLGFEFFQKHSKSFRHFVFPSLKSFGLQKALLQKQSIRICYYGRNVRFSLIIVFRLANQRQIGFLRHSEPHDSILISSDLLDVHKVGIYRVIGPDNELHLLVFVSWQVARSRIVYSRNRFGCIFLDVVRQYFRNGILRNFRY